VKGPLQPIVRFAEAGALLLITAAAGCTVEPVTAVSGSASGCGRAPPTKIRPEQLAVLSDWVNEHRGGWLPNLLVAPPASHDYELIDSGGRTTTIFLL